MCGQVGIIFGQKDRSRKELDYFAKVFAYLLLLSEERGPHATGAAWLKRDGRCRILKRPQKAKDFIREAAFRNLLLGIDSDVTWLAGHNRWQTVGEASNNRNNHPLVTGQVIGTHNGTVLNADDLFERFSLPRAAEVDSEVIFRMADDTLRDGSIDLAAFKKRLALCRGQVSAVMASRANPGEVVIIKGNKPLEVWCHKGCQMVIYASDSNYLGILLVGQKGWRPVDLHMMSIATIKCDRLAASTCEPFDLTG